MANFRLPVKVAIDVFSITWESFGSFWTAEPNVTLNMCAHVQRCHLGLISKFSLTVFDLSKHNSNCSKNWEMQGGKTNFYNILLLKSKQALIPTIVLLKKQEKYLEIFSTLSDKIFLQWWGDRLLLFMKIFDKK